MLLLNGPDVLSNANRELFKVVAEQETTWEVEEFRKLEMTRLRSSEKQRTHLRVIVDNTLGLP